MYIGTLLSYRPTLLRVCRISVPFAHSRLRLRRAHTWEKMETLRFGHTLNEGGTASYRPRLPQQFVKREIYDYTRCSNLAAFSFRISGRTSGLMPICSKSAIQRSGVMNG